MTGQRNGFQPAPGGVFDLPVFRTPPAPGRSARDFTVQLVRGGASPSRPAGGRPAPASREERAERAGRSATDWGLVSQLRRQASERLSQRTAGQRLTSADQEQLGRAVITELLTELAAEQVRAGEPGLTPAGVAGLERAVFDALFRLGRLQPLLDDAAVENVIIADGRAFVEDTSGRLREADPVADSDVELIEFLQFVASRSESSARPFSEADPFLELRLDDGSRLAAVAWVSARPGVVVRKHRLMHDTLADLVSRGTLTRTCAEFLAAAVRAKCSIVVSGEQGAGKTTLLRALCAELDPDEVIATFETDAELGLDRMPERHRIVFALEERPGSGEVTGSGERLGAVSMGTQMLHSFRWRLDRAIVGEVRGAEVWSMLNAMESGAGSLSTTHAKDAATTMRKLTSRAMQAGVPAEVAAEKLAEAIDLVVHIARTDTIVDGEPARRRVVSEVVAVGRGESLAGWALTGVFTSPEPGSAATSTGLLPDDLGVRLAGVGFDPAHLSSEAGVR